MSNIAKEITAKITGENESFYFLQYTDDLVRLDKSEGEHELDDSVTGFLYRDRNDKMRLTTKEIEATTEQFGWGTVVDVRKDLGAFVDTGLPEKDVVVSLDDFPEEKSEWPKKGDKLLVKLTLDSKERLWGKLAWAEDFWQKSQPAYDNMQNQDLPGIVYRNKESGTFVYLPENNMLGFIHPSEKFGTLRIGQELNVRVIGFRKEDRSLNLSAKPRSYEMLDNDAQMILTYLQGQNGQMTFNDKSSPDEIKATFGISKGQFKKALGGLMKQGKIKQNPEGTTLI